MDRFTRILLLHRELATARYPVPRVRLEERLECSAASIKRIISEMRTYLGAPVEYDRVSNGYYYAKTGERPFELPGLWFSAAELFALASMQALLAGLGPGLLDNSLRPFRNRLEQLLCSEGAGLAELPQRVRLLALAGRTPEPDAFQHVAAATLQRRRLRAEYHARSSGDRLTRELSPQRLVLYRHNWYLDAWCHLRGQLRTFAIERLKQVKVLETPAHDLPATELDAHYAGGYGIFAGPANDIAVLRFDPAPARWVSEERWHPEQQGQWLPDGRYELRFPYANPTELVMDILRYGPEVEVMAPPALRERVKERLAAALRRYVKTVGSEFEPPGVVEDRQSAIKETFHERKR